MNIILKILLVIWQLPQSLVFACTYLYLLARKEVSSTREYENKKVVYHKNDFLTCCGLGEFIIMRCGCNETVLKHELGHCKQSLYLGWLYLLVVGLPSVILNLRSRNNEEIRKNYYTYFPENWADKLGGVDR